MTSLYGSITADVINICVRVRKKKQDSRVKGMNGTVIPEEGEREHHRQVERRSGFVYDLSGILFWSR